MGSTIKVKGRLAFPELFEAKSVNDGAPRFSAVIILDPADKAQTKLIDDAIAAAAKEKWNAKADAIVNELRKQRRVCYLKEPKTSSEGAVFAGFEDSHSISASSPTRPVLKDRDGVTPLTAAEGRPYAGCYVVASIDVWCQDNKHGKRINGTLRWVQFWKDGDAFTGGTPVADDEFESLDAEDELPL